MASLKISEIFLSLQGEARTSGLPTVFVRLTGCPLRCTYCDSAYAFYGGERFTIEEILQKVDDYRARAVCVTGGEPLAQVDAPELISQLCDKGYDVSVETSGAKSIKGLDPRASIVMDLKTPSSGEMSRNDYDNLKYLKPKDQLKFVIGSREDYEWSRFSLEEKRLSSLVDDIFFSPCFGEIEPRDLAEWIIEDRLPVRFQTQIHKTLWGDKPGV